MSNNARMCLVYGKVYEISFFFCKSRSLAERIYSVDIGIELIRELNALTSMCVRYILEHTLHPLCVLFF